MYQTLAIKVLTTILAFVPAALVSDQVTGTVARSVQSGCFLWMGEDRIPKSMK